MPETERYYTIPELATLWECSHEVIYRYLRRGTLDGFKLGCSWRISDAARLACERRLTEAAKPAVTTRSCKIH